MSKDGQIHTDMHTQTHTGMITHTQIFLAKNDKSEEYLQNIYSKVMCIFCIRRYKNTNKLYGSF